MKFLIVSAVTGYSGSAIRFTHIAVHLKRLGHEVVYVERDGLNVKLKPLPDGVEYHRCPVSGRMFIDIAWATIYNLFFLLQNLDADIFYAMKPGPNTCIPAVVARVLGKRIILDVDDIDYGYLKPGLARSISRFFFDFFPRHFSLVTCHTKNLMHHLTHDLHVPGSRVYFLAQGVSDAFLRWTPPVKTPEKSIVYSATLGLTSDFPDLLPMFERVLAGDGEVRVKIIGEGIHRVKFQEMVKERGLSSRIAFLGWVDHEKLPEVLANNWIGVNYMRRSFHNDCRAILKIREYLAVGLQVVCNEVGDVGEFAEYVGVEADMQAIADTVLAQLSRGFNRNVNGREYVCASLNWEQICGRFASVI